MVVDTDSFYSALDSLLCGWLLIQIACTTYNVHYYGWLLIHVDCTLYMLGGDLTARPEIQR